MKNPSKHNIKGILREVKGDVTLPQAASLRYIVQVVNSDGEYNAKSGEALASRWPKVKSEYRQLWRERYGKLRFGDIQIIQVLSDLIVINMIAEIGGKTDGESLKACLAKVGAEVSDHNASVHIARTSCGAWDDVKDIIDEQLIQRTIDVTVYDSE